MSSFLHFLYMYFEFLKVALWPAVIFASIFLLRNHVKEVFFNYNGVEVRVAIRNLKEARESSKAKLSDLKKQNPQAARALEEQIDEMYKAAMSVVRERAKVVESGRNSDGSHRLYNNGQVVQEIFVPSGELVGRKIFYFPVTMKEVTGISFYGKDKPNILHVDSNKVELELVDKNASEIVVKLSGIL